MCDPVVQQRVVHTCEIRKKHKHKNKRTKEQKNKRTKEATKEYQDCDEMEQAHISVPLSFPLLFLN